MATVKNNLVEFESDDVAQNILLAKNWKMHKENMANDTSETENGLENKKTKSQWSKWNNKKCWSCKKTKAHCKCWRKTVITDEVINLLYMAFCMNYTDAQACLYAWIWTTAFYDYQNKNPKFTEHKALLKETTKMYAKANIFKSLVNGNVENSMWLLERLEKQTYSKVDMIETNSTVTVRDPLRERLLELQQQKQEAEEQKKIANSSQKVITISKPKAKKKVFKIVKS